MTIYYGDVCALIDPEQSELLASGQLLQDVSVILIDDWDDPADAMRPSAVTLSPQRARDLAFCLLELAELAQRIQERR